MFMMSKFILDELDKMYPNPKCELEYNKDYELLLATMLSAQTTDKRVNLVTRELFSKYDTLDKLSNMSISEIESYIKSIGMYKEKAKYFKSIVNGVIYMGGYVVNDRDKLLKLDGVGRKTVNVVLSNLYNKPCIAVDTHVDRVSKRLGLVSSDGSVLVIENKLMEIFPKDKWSRLHHQLVLFGRYKCKSKNPSCIDCPFKDICNYKKDMK